MTKHYIVEILILQLYKKSPHHHQRIILNRSKDTSPLASLINTIAIDSFHGTHFLLNEVVTAYIS